MTVKQLLQTVDSKELSEWAAFYSIEPFGYFRSADLPASVISSTIANCNRTKNSKSFSPNDFILVGEHSKEKAMGEEEMQNILQAMTGKEVKGADR